MSKEDWFAAYEAGLNSGMGQGEAARTAPERIRNPFDAFLTRCVRDSIEGYPPNQPEDEEK